MSRGRFFSFKCDCGNQLECNVVSERDSSFYVETAVTCEDDSWLSGPRAGQLIKGCGKLWDQEAIEQKFEREISEMLAEPREPYDD